MSEALATQTTFDYGALDAAVRKEVITERNGIQKRLRRSSEDIIEIGKSLNRVKDRLPHGQFGPWLRAEFEWSQDTAANFMKVAQVFGDIPKISEFAPSALYALASSSVPQELRDQFLEQAKRGEPVTHSQVQEAIKSQAEPRTVRVSYAPQEEAEPLRIRVTHVPREPEPPIVMATFKVIDRNEEEEQPSPPLLSIVDLETGEVVDPGEEEGRGTNATDGRTQRWAIPSISRQSFEVNRLTPQDHARHDGRNARIVLERTLAEIHRDLIWVDDVDYGQLDEQGQKEWRQSLELAQNIVSAIAQHIPQKGPL